MRPTREAAIAALWIFLQSLVLPNGMSWGERQRGLKQVDQVPPGNQPAMFLQQGPQRTAGRREHGVQTWEYTNALLIYFRCEKNSLTEDWGFANTLLDSLETLLAPQIMTMYQTLNGVVHDCYIDGEIGLYENMDDENQAVLFVPITILSGI